MSDLIRRADALKALEKLCEKLEAEIADAKDNPEKYMDNFIVRMGDQVVGIAHAYHELYDISSADRLTIVRCKDCRWYKPLYKDKEYDCPQGLYAVYGNDYCSHGERGEE